MGSDLLKPYLSRRQTTPAVERPCPAPKGLRPFIFCRSVIPFFVERPCPVLKGLRDKSSLIFILYLNTVERPRPARKGETKKFKDNEFFACTAYPTCKITKPALTACQLRIALVVIGPMKKAYFAQMRAI